MFPVALALAGTVLALWVVLPFRSVAFTRSDGVVVKLPAPDRLDHTSDTWDYLQIAREIYRSHRYESLFTYVPFLPDWNPSPDIKSGTVQRFPVLWRQPGFPLLLAGAFALRGGTDPDALLWVQGAAIVVLPLATYVLALGVLSPGWAFAAAFWALLTPLAVSPGSPFVATTWFAGMVALLAGLVVRGGHWVRMIVAGALLGLAIAFRLETWMLVPGLLLMLWLGESSNRVRNSVVLLGTAALVLVPWTRCRAQCAGEGFTLSSLLYHATDTFPGWTSSRTLAVRELSPLGFLTDHFGEVAKKAALNLLRYGRDLALFPSPFLAPLVWLAVLRPPAESRSRAFVLGVAFAALTLVLLLSPLEYSPRFLGVLAPLFAVTAVIGMSRAVRYRRALVVVATTVGILLTGTSVMRRSATGTSRLAAEDLNLLMKQPETQGLRGDVGAGIALCDTPTLFAWIWEARALWTPLPEDIPKVRERLAGFGCVALFTRAGGHGDGIAQNTVEEYAKTGAIASALEPPLLMIWPEDEPR